MSRRWLRPRGRDRTFAIVKRVLALVLLAMSGCDWCDTDADGVGDSVGTCDAQEICWANGKPPGSCN